LLLTEFGFAPHTCDVLERGRFKLTDSGFDPYPYDVNGNVAHIAGRPMKGHSAALFAESPETALDSREIGDLVLKYMPLALALAGTEGAAQRARGWFDYDERDLSQELLLRMPELIRRYDPKRGVTLGAYLKRYLTWQAKDYISQERRWVDVMDEYDETNTVPFQESRGKQSRGKRKITLRASRSPEEQLADAINPVQDKDWRMLDLRYWQDMKQAEIARLLKSTRLQVCRELDRLDKKIHDSLNKSPSENRSIPWERSGPRKYQVPKFRPWMRKYFFRVRIEVTPDHPLYRDFAASRRQNRERVSGANVTQIRITEPATSVNPTDKRTE
jgi:RNA polymerase sigma factor (sigma-70 family)